MNTNDEEANWLIAIDRDVFALITQQIQTGQDPYQTIQQLVMEQPEMLRCGYAMELARRLARNTANLLLDMHGGQAEAGAAVAAAALNYEQVVGAGVWTTTTTPPPTPDTDTNE